MRHMMPSSCIHVISEPGDATRYDYIIHMDGPYQCTFAPARSTFPYPRRMDKAEAVELADINSEYNKVYSEKNRCNRHTTMECARAVMEIFQMKPKEKPEDTDPEWAGDE